jgi:hypothetical protein
LSKNHGLLSKITKETSPPAERAKTALKESAASLLKANSKQLTILTHPETQGAFFGNIVIFVEPEGKAYFVDRKGKFYSEHLKDRLIGGQVMVETKAAGPLFTLFYGKPGDPELFTAYLDTTKVKVRDFKLDRETGNIQGNIILPSGKELRVTRKGRDNATVRLGDKLVSPLFL